MMETKILRRKKHQQWVMGEMSIAPLAFLRAGFGGIMLISTCRFIVKGWVYDFYIAPTFHFPFFGLEWLRPLPALGMYAIFIGMASSALFIMLGLFYRLSVGIFLGCFVYTELLDKTYYLNHYYLVTILAFLLLWVPAGRYFSLDILRRPSLRLSHVPAWTIRIFQMQLLLVYFFAGLSKLTGDWLLRAMPLRIWLPANGNIPFIGPLLSQTGVAYSFSWFGAFFDLAIGFLLLYRPTTKFAYVVVVFFHLVTGWLFKIGMFPYIMIAVTVIFFSHPVGHPNSDREGKFSRDRYLLAATRIPALLLYFTLQILLPLRFLLYPGTLFWTEEGYRFSWRVMLMEKSGTGFFYVRDPATGRRGEVDNAKFLTPLQERMMATQPDMILQYAHYLHGVYSHGEIHDPIITVEDYVTLNGSGSRLYIDSTVNLAREQETFLPARWILPFNNTSSSQ